jgi:hypothetical protein
MTRKHLLFVMIFTLALASCTQLVAPSPLATPAPSPLTSPQTVSDVYITYRRNGGLAGSHDTWIIDLQGKLTHQGSGASSQLTAAQMAELAAAIHAADFMALQNSFLSKDICCDRYEYTITITANGQSKTVRTNDASPIAPPKLMQLIDTLNQLVITPAPAVQ